MLIAIAQMNSAPGDIQGNFEKMKHNIMEAYSKGASIIVFPELAVQGYPALDLYINDSFNKASKEALNEIYYMSNFFPGLTIMFGATFDDCPFNNKSLYNSMFIVKDGKLLNIINKKLIPDYDIFFEGRYFNTGEAWFDPVITLYEKTFGFLICEDLWDENYDVKPYKEITSKYKTEIMVSINASPFVIDKMKVRHELVREKILSTKGYPERFIYVNSVGGQDGYEGDVIFDGGSFVMNSEGNVIFQAPQFEEGLYIVDLDNDVPVPVEEKNSIAQIEAALIMGIRSYFERCGLQRAIIGLSGGIDSAVVAVLAVKSLGKDNVMGITMPSSYSSSGSVDDSVSLAENLGIDILNIPIKKMVDTYREELQEGFNQTGRGEIKHSLTEENLQARVRGQILMAYANSKPGTIVLSTGNKTELALGYCTAYGDMCGGMSPISDLDKLKVYELARYMNRDREIIPKNTITKPPSAELAPGQTDEKGLGGSYEIIANMVNDIIEGGLFKTQLIEKYGCEQESLIDKCLRLIVINEWKRRQAPPAIKVTDKAFGNGRRIPMSHKFNA